MNLLNLKPRGSNLVLKEISNQIAQKIYHLVLDNTHYNNQFRLFSDLETLLESYFETLRMATIFNLKAYL